MTDFQSTTLNLAQAQARYQAFVDAKTLHDTISAGLAALQVEAAQALKEAQALAGAASVGVLTSTDQTANVERTAGQRAVVTAVKGGQTEMTEDEAKVIWRAGALAARPADRQWLLCDPDALLREYEVNLGLEGWEAFRAWILATPVDQMGI